MLHALSLPKVVQALGVQFEPTVLNRGIFCSPGTLATSGDNLGVTTWGRESCWHLVGRAEGSCSAPYKAQDSPTRENYPSPNVHSAEKLRNQLSINSSQISLLAGGMEPEASSLG